jgi:hypothetical protein
MTTGGEPKMKKAPKIDRSTLEYTTSYHPAHVIVNAAFEAHMVSGERGHYQACVFLDPRTGALLLKRPYTVRVLRDDRDWARHPRGPHMDRSFDFLEELSSVVARSAVWKKYMAQGPDPHLIILRDGTEIREHTPEYESHPLSYLWRGGRKKVA